MFDELLNKELNTFKSKIASNIRSAGKSATGKTAESQKVTVNSNGDVVKGKLDAAKWFFTLETGRGPGKNPPVNPIKEWLKARGYQGNLGVAFYISKQIGEFGTKLHQQGGRKDIFSNVINENSIKGLEDKIADMSLKASADFIIQSYEKGN